MTAKEIKEAFKNNTPVILNMPNADPIKNCRITAVIYRRNSNTGRIMVSCELPDPKSPRSVIIARGRNLEIMDKEKKEVKEWEI